MENKIKALLATLAALGFFILILYGTIHYAHFMGVIISAAFLGAAIYFMYRMAYDFFEVQSKMKQEKKNEQENK